MDAAKKMVGIEHQASELNKGLTAFATISQAKQGWFRAQGSGSAIAHIIAAGAKSHGLRITGKSGPIRAVIRAFDAAFARDEGVRKLINFQSLPDQSQGSLHRLFLGTNYINTTQADLLTFQNEPQDRHDLTMYIAFKRFQDKHFKDQKEAIENHKQLIIVLVPVIFDHYCRISDTDSYQRRNYKKMGLSYLEDFLNNAKEVIRSNKSLFDDVTNLTNTLAFAKTVTLETADEVDTAFYLRDAAEAIKKELGMMSVWLKFLTLISISRKPLPTTFIKDALVRICRPFDHDKIHYDLSPELGKATKLVAPQRSELNVNDRRSLQILWRLNHAHVLHCYLQDYIRQTSRFSELSERHRRGEALHLSENACHSDRNQAMCNLLAAMKQSGDKPALYVNKILRAEKIKSTSVHLYYTRLCTVFSESIRLHHLTVLFFRATQQLCRVCDQHGDRSIHIASISEYLVLLKKLIVEVAEHVNRSHKLATYEENDGLTYYSKAKNTVLTKKVLSNDKPWVHHMLSRSGIPMYIQRLTDLCAMVSSKCISDKKFHPHSFCVNAFDLYLDVYRYRYFSCLIDRDSDNLDHNKSMMQRYECQVKKVTRDIQRRTIPEQIVHAALSLTQRAGHESGSLNEEPDAQDLESQQGQSISDLLSEMTSYKDSLAAAQRATAQADQLRNTVMDVLQAVSQAVHEYSEFVEKRVSWSGRNLTGSHTSKHVLQAGHFVRTLLRSYNQSDLDLMAWLAFTKREIDQYRDPFKAIGPLHLFKRSDVKHPFAGFLKRKTSTVVWPQEVVNNDEILESTIN